MTASTRVLAGDCTVIERAGGDRSERRGQVVAVVKPDDTVLVHDRDGYQPVAWLTRADAVVWGPDAGHPERGRSSDGGTSSAPDAPDATGFSLVARKGEDRLWIAAHDETGVVSYPTSAAGTPVGTCPDCGRRLVRTGKRVACLGCSEGCGIPSDATVRDDACECGLPRIRVERGTAFDLCLDRTCDRSRTLDEAVQDAFDGAWDCPECGGDLRVLRRGGLIAGCEAYPDCDTGFAIPAGTVVEDCDCGLPVFETPTGRRCLDSTCGG